MKTDGHFKLSKSTKRLMSSILDKTERAFFKTTMINAEYAFIHNKRKPKQDKLDKTE